MCGLGRQYLVHAYSASAVSLLLMMRAIWNLKPRSFDFRYLPSFESVELSKAIPIVHYQYIMARMLEQAGITKRVAIEEQDFTAVVLVGYGEQYVSFPSSVNYS